MVEDFSLIPGDVDNAHVRRAVIHIADDLPYGSFQKDHAALVQGSVIIQQAEEMGDHGGWIAGDADAPVAPGPAHLLHKAGTLQDATGLLIALPSGICQMHTLAGADKERQAQFVLQHGDILADAGLRRVERLRRPAGAAQFSGFDEAFQLAEFHMRFLFPFDPFHSWKRRGSDSYYPGCSGLYR